MSSIMELSVEGEVGIVAIDNPPVNALGSAVRQALLDGFTQMAGDARVKVVVLYCKGRTFFAGADISEFGKPPVEPILISVLAELDRYSKPVIAAIHGTALGGGYELALVCTHRIAVPSAKVGLPEVKLGILPGAGGTQRLPRLVGIPAALEIIGSGEPVPAAKALELGMIDALAAEGRLLEDAVAFARSIAASGQTVVRVRDRQDKVAPYKGDEAVYAEYLQRNAKQFRGQHAPLAIVDAIRGAAELPFDEGLKQERALFEKLQAGSQSQALRYCFFAERQTVRVPDVPAGTPTRSIRTVGVIGAGTMGGGIAMNFLNAGLPVTLVETRQDALDRGIEVIRRNYLNSAKRGQLSEQQVSERMALITPSLDLGDLAEADLVIEAVFEEMSIKQQVFADLDRVAKPGAILASNTSYLDLDEIARATSRPQDLVGLHFFSPANVMRLLEVVRAEHTTREVIATAMGLAKIIAKTPVLSRVGYGFIANRVMTVRGKHAERLVLEGPTPQDIDRALTAYGFAMGPFQMMDLVGHDVVGRGNTERTLRGDLVALDRLGQKKNGGFYDYDENRKPTPSPIAAQVIADFAAWKGVTATRSFTDEEIVARLLYPVVNECARVVEEGIALRPSDVDVACMLGYNWPRFTGGPMFWADTVGLDRIVSGLEEMGETPASLLRRRAAEGDRLSEGEG